MCDSVKAEPPMDLFQKLGVTDAGEMMKLVLQAQKSLETQQKKENRKQKEEEKKEEKKKMQEEKEKKRLQPIKEVNGQFKKLRKVERAFNMEINIQSEAVQNRVTYWLRNVMDPYNVFLQGDKANEVFKTNAHKFVDLIREFNGNKNLGIITSSLRRGSERFFIKTEHGILTGTHASAYLKYIIRNKCLKPIKQMSGELFRNSRVVLDKDGSMRGDECFQELSMFQLFNELSLCSMVKHLVNQSYDDAFAKSWQRASLHPEVNISKLPEEVKCKIANDRSGGEVVVFSDTESEAEEEENESDSDSD